MRRPTVERLEVSGGVEPMLHLAPLGAALPDWHVSPPRALDAAEAAARVFAPGSPRDAARAYGVLVRAAGIGHVDVVERLGGFDRGRLIREGE